MLDSPFKSAVMVGILGLIPALVLLFAFQLGDDGLVVLGTQIASDYHADQLPAAVIGAFSPLLMLLPIAFTFSGYPRDGRYWITVCALAPLLFGPVLLATMIKGGGFGRGFVSVMLLILFILNHALWLELGKRRLRNVQVLVIWGALWVCADFINYLGTYILPYFEFKVLTPLTWIGVLLPRFGSYTGQLDAYLVGGEISWKFFIVTLVQVIALAFALRLSGRPQNEVHEVDQ